MTSPSTITMYGADWCRDCVRTKKQLDELGISYTYIDLVADPAATFFDPHTTYGMVSAFESILMAQRMPYGEVARMALLGTAERMSARRAYEVGLVSEVTEPGGAVAAAVRCAEIVAGCPPEAVEGTVRACWAAQEVTRTQALAHASQLISLGNQTADHQGSLFAARERRDGFRTR